MIKKKIKKYRFSTSILECARSKRYNHIDFEQQCTRVLNCLTFRGQMRDWNLYGPITHKTSIFAWQERLFLLWISICDKSGW